MTEKKKNADFNLNDQRIWDQLFEKVPEQWKQAQPTQDMQDCLLFLQQHKVESVLDLGCGIGLWAMYLSKAGLRVKGVDFSAKAIDFASRWANEEGQSIGYRCAAVTSRAFPEERFHAVVAAKILDNISRPEFEIARDHIVSNLVDEGLLFCLFNPFMTDRDLKRLSESDNPTRDVTQTIYSDEELRELFPRFDLLEFRRYEHGFRGLFLRKRRALSVTNNPVQD